MDRKYRMSKRGIKSARNLIYLFILIEASALAQEAYQYELGFGGGLSTYTGDVSRSIIAPASTDRNVFLRSNRSSRFAFCIDYNTGKAKGNAQDLNIKLPNPNGLTIKSFTTKYQSLDILFETNFLPYPKQKTVSGSSNITPFYFFGLGVKQYSILAAIGGDGKGDGNTVSIPIGFGLKWKFEGKWGIQYRFKVEKLLTDKFDGDFLDEPYEFEQAIKFHRQDFLYLNTISLVYHFGQSKWDCNCNKDQRRKNDKNPL